MKIKVEVDLSDFYDEDEDGADFSTQIKDHIAWSVKQEVFRDWKKIVTTEFTRYVVSEIEKSKINFVDRTLKDMIVSEKVKKRYGSDGELVSVVDYIREEIKRMYITGDYVRTFIESETKTDRQDLEGLAIKLVSEMKKKYDLLFASQLVSKLNDQGMLKKDVAKILLEDN